MTGSIKHPKLKIDTIRDVTSRGIEIIKTTDEGKKGYLVQEDASKANEGLKSYFTRGATHIVNGHVFDKKRYEDEGEDKFKIEYLNQLSSIMSPEFIDYQMQNFISISTGMVNVALGCNPEYYHPKFSNGRVCHFWNENIDGEDHLCLLSVDDSLIIGLDADEKEIYIPGAMMLEVQVPCSVIKKKEPITVDHITRVLVSTKALDDLLHANSELLSLYQPAPEVKPLAEKLKSSLDELLKKASKTPPKNSEMELAMIRDPKLKDYIHKPSLCHRPLFFKQEAQQQESTNVGSLIRRNLSHKLL